MNPRVYREFERVCTERHAGGAVLEIGAVPSNQSLLCMKSLKNAREKVGVNLNGPHDYDDFTILKCNANSMDCFEDGRFDTVLCNATLEHDKQFWLTLSEIRRVTKPGGLVVIGTPGYVTYRIEKAYRSIAQRIPFVPARLRRLPTITTAVHNYPGDFYRFSPHAHREVFFRGMKDTRIRTIMVPPKIIGSALAPDLCQVGGRQG